MSKAVYHWITESTRNSVLNGSTIESQIQTILDNETPSTIPTVVYRGQQSHSRKIFPRSWFSTSSDKAKVLRQHISKGADCCLFKIHVLPGIKRFSVDEYLTKASHKATKYDESEIIVDGKGHFYANSGKTEDGFQEIGQENGVTVFETWYAPPKRAVGKNELLTRILPDERDFYNNVNALKRAGLLGKNETATNETYAALLKELKPSAGGKRKTRRRRRSI